MSEQQKMQHTPGPWEAKRANDGCGDIGIVGSGGVVAECFHEIREKGEAAHDECASNARLIAAAPALLETLKRIADGKVMDPGRPFTHFDVVEAYQSLARVAITKATGAPT